MSNNGTNGDLSDVDFAYVRDLVREHSGIILGGDKRYLVESRVTPIVRRESLASLSDLVRRLRSRPYDGLHRRVTEAMTTNETSFFRDHRPFEALRETLIPELVERRAGDRRLRIWCAACSSGQEPYSVAMLIREHFPALASWDVDILGTDISTNMIRRAQQGRYSQLEVNRGLPAHLLVKYFEKVGSEWQIDTKIRDQVTYRQMNLLGGCPAYDRWDVVLLRNLLIYFDTDTKRSLLASVGRQLQPDGYLFLGGAETTLNLSDEFERVPVASAGCYRMRAHATARGRSTETLLHRSLIY